MLSRVHLACLVASAIFAGSLASGSPISNENESSAKTIVIKDLNGGSFDIYEKNLVSDENKADLLAYEPVAKRRLGYDSSSWQARNDDNLIKLNLEREGVSESSSSKPKRGQEGVLSVAASTADEINSPNVDRFGSIAFNSREVRFVGPNQREVEMKDDMPSKVIAVLDNLQKEASNVYRDVNEKLDKGWQDIKRSEVWGQVNEKLDKGWTDLKSIVESVVAPTSKRQQP